MSESGEAGLTARVISSGIPPALSRSVLDHGRCSARLYNGPDSILLVVRQERPDNPSILVRQRDGSPVLAASGDEGSQPLTPVITLRIDPAQRGSRAVNQQFTQIAIPAFTDPKEPWFTPCGVFPRDQSQPGCQLAAVLELGHVTDRGDQRGGRHRADPGDGLQSLTFRMGLTHRGQLLIVLHQALVQGEKLVIEVPEDLRTQRGQFRLISLQLRNDQGAKLSCSELRTSAALLDNSAWVLLTFAENETSFLVTLHKNVLGFSKNSLRTSHRAHTT
jgi:hypothetical protein